MSSLCSQRDHSRKETFCRGAVKLCGEWEGDAFGIFARLRDSLLAVTPQEWQLRTHKNNSASYAG